MACVKEIIHLGLMLWKRSFRLDDVQPDISATECSQWISTTVSTWCSTFN